MAIFDFDPRLEADAQIARALRIVVEACNGQEVPVRDYTPQELEDLFFALSMAMVQLAKVPGGHEAKERFYANAKTELLKRKPPTLAPVP